MEDMNQILLALQDAGLPHLTFAFWACETWEFNCRTPSHFSIGENVPLAGLRSIAPGLASRFMLTLQGRQIIVAVGY